MKAKFLSVGVRDVIKGFIVAALTSVMTALVTILQSSGLPNVSDFKTMAIAGLAAGIAYLVKNVLTNSNDQFLRKEPKNETN